MFNATVWPIYPRQSPRTHCMGIWVISRVGLEGRGKSHPHQNSIAGTSNP